MKYKKSTALVSCMLCVALQPVLAYADKPLHVDYAIVGVGTAGAVLARELSNDKKTSVVALHNGNNFTDVPFIKYSANATFTVPGVLAGPPLAEIGVTIPQPNVDDRELSWVIPLPEGGASAINAGAYCRGTTQLYSKWEEIAGEKWSVKRIVKLYKKLEHYHGKTTNPSSRGFHGPISVRQVPHPSKVGKIFTKATIKATGFPFVLDYNDYKTPIGVSSNLQYTQSGHDGKFRVLSPTAFLDEKILTQDGHGVDGRKLRVLFNTTGLRTIWKGNKAIGVEFLQDGKVKKVFARKGVIVCAGLRSSPFLMYSGVGPKALLDSLQIPVKFDNPNVGQNLADQPSVRFLFSSNPSDIPLDPNDSLFGQISWLPVPGGNQKIRELRLAVIDQVPGLTPLLLDLVQPKSRGSVTINSRDPLAPPVIDFGFLTNPEDLDALQKGTQVYIKAINQAIQRINPAYKLIVPDPAILDDATLVTDYIKATLASNQSFQSHCRMASQDNGGVVDSKGRVYGVKHLIVADNSVAPLIMDGSTMATAYLIAANIAEMLLENE